MISTAAATASRDEGRECVFIHRWERPALSAIYNGAKLRSVKGDVNRERRGEEREEEKCLSVMEEGLKWQGRCGETDRKQRGEEDVGKHGERRK